MIRVKLQKQSMIFLEYRYPRYENTIIIWWILIYCIYEVKAHAQDVPRSEYIIQENIHTLKPWQIAIFTYNDVNLSKKQSDYFFRHHISRIPTTMIDLTKIRSTGDNRSLQMPIFKNPRLSTIYLLFHNALDFDSRQICNNLEYLVAIAPVPSRPRCLLIFHSDRNWSELEIEEIARHAWSLKFLDFSILKISSDNHISFFNYNPFTKTYNMGNLKSFSGIFPDKLNNVYKYPLKLQVFNVPPFVTVRNETHKEIDVAGMHYMYIKTILKKLNFSLHLTLIENRNFTEVSENLLIKLDNNEMIITPMAFQINSFLHGRNLIIGNYLNLGKLAIIVPIIPATQIHFSTDILIHIFSLPLFIISFLILVRLMKLEMKQWEVLNIFQILIGMPIPQPRRIRERIIFFLIVVFSITYSGTFFAKVTDIKLIYDEIHFNTFEDLYKSKMTIYTPYFAKDYEDAETQELFLNSKQVESDVDCIHLLIKSNNVICITPYFTAKLFVMKSLDANGFPIMKMGQFFRFEYVAFPHEKSSPYAEKIDKNIRHLIESGIPTIWEYQAFKGGAKMYESKRKSNVKDIFSFQLIIILFVGVLLSTMVFLVELATKRTDYFSGCNILHRKYLYQTQCIRCN